ncbi:MAG: serine hydrolase domain-containing protein [Ignavibacteria bacterium]
MVKKLACVVIPLISLMFTAVYGYDFTNVDRKINQAIEDKAFPGATLIIGNQYDVIYAKAYGKYTYDPDSKPTSIYTIYDLASLTKVVATTTAIMKLYEENKLSLDDKVVTYLPEFNNNGKEKITIRNLLLHNSGLQDLIKFYQLYSTREQAIDAIFHSTPVYETGTKFLYSDLNAILLGMIVEKVSGLPLDEYCKRDIFQPLNMYYTIFNPNSDLKEFIAPTEFDSYWRNRLLQGEVHDESASFLGGVAGNAGLFSNAPDLYKFMRMMLNRGKIIDTDVTYLREETVNTFTHRYDESYSNTRALGWDTKPAPTKHRSPCGELFSDNSFGHTGFTGTSIWCDRDKNLIIIFLTNRVYPTRNNNRIMDIRPELHNTIVEAITKVSKN